MEKGPVNVIAQSNMALEITPRPTMEPDSLDSNVSSSNLNSAKLQDRHTMRPMMSLKEAWQKIFLENHSTIGSAPLGIETNMILL